MIEDRNGELFVVGAMNQYSAAQLLEQGTAAMGSSDCRINLREVTSLDSSALALVLAWMRRVRSTGHQLTVIEPPASFVSLARLYGVDDMLMAASGVVQVRGE